MFEHILGHEQELAILKNSIKQKTISHSYLFTGPSGIGKLQIALEFAKELLQVEQLMSCPDFVLVNKREDKKNILVEQIREEMIENIYVRPATGDRKVYIINNAEYLNETAQNALLKTLEEPPSYVVIILVAASTTTILPTVMSRVSKLVFQKLSDELIETYLKQNRKIEIDKDSISFADGSLGQVLDMIDGDILTKLEATKTLYDCIQEKESVKAFKVSEEIDFSSPYLLEYLQYLFYKNENYHCVGLMQKTKERLKYNGNYDVVIDNMILDSIDKI